MADSFSITSSHALKLRRQKALLIACAILLVLGTLCGLTWLGTHTYRDNESNFQRIFGYARPSDVIVYRSEFWEGRHFFFLLHESSWHIELDGPQEFTSQFITEIFSKSANPSPNRDDTLPEWFAPKASDAYDRWDAMDPSGQFTLGSLFMDKETGRTFIYYNDF